MNFSELINLVSNINHMYINLSDVLEEEINLLINFDYSQIEQMNQKKINLSQHLNEEYKKLNLLLGNKSLENFKDHKSFKKIYDEFKISQKNVELSLKKNSNFLKKSIEKMDKINQITKNIFFHKNTYDKKAKSISSAQKGINLIKNY